MKKNDTKNTQKTIEKQDGRKKNGNKDIRKYSLATRFTSTNQPTPDDKKSGKLRNKVFVDLLNTMCQLMLMTDEEQNAWKKNGKLTMLDYIALRQVKHMADNPNLLFNYINKHVPDLPTNINMSVEEKDPLSTKEKIQRLLKIAEVTKKQMELGYLDENGKTTDKQD